MENLKIYRFKPLLPDGILQEFFVFAYSYGDAKRSVMERLFINHWYNFNEAEYNITQHDIFEGQYFITAPIPKR